MCLMKRTEQHVKVLTVYAAFKPLFRFATVNWTFLLGRDMNRATLSVREQFQTVAL